MWPSVAPRKKPPPPAVKSWMLRHRRRMAQDPAQDQDPADGPPQRGRHLPATAWLPIFVSFFTGWLAGILGIGGGLIRMPALIYMIGCPTHVAVGTDLFEVIISGLYGAATYTYKGRTELVAAMIMLVGAAMGAQVGTVATKYIKGYGIRIAFGLAVIGCAVSILMKLVQPWLPQYKALLDNASTVLVLGLVSCMSLYIFVRMIAGVKEELRRKQQNV